MTLVDKNLWRGPRPTQDDLKQFKHVISLEEGWFEFFHGKVRQEQNWCLDAGIEFCHQPMSDFFAPTKDQLYGLLRPIRRCMMSEGQTLVHCLHGEDRTGIVIAAYRIVVQKWNLTTATDEMYAKGFHKFPYGWWVPVLGNLP